MHSCDIVIQVSSPAFNTNTQPITTVVNRYGQR
jgi:hypothetical protein